MERATHFLCVLGPPLPRPGSSGERLRCASWQALLPERCVKRVWREIWRGERPRRQGGNTIPTHVQTIACCSFDNIGNMEFPNRSCSVSSPPWGLGTKEKWNNTRLRKVNTLFNWLKKKRHLEYMSRSKIFLFRLFKGIRREVRSGEGKGRQVGAGLRLQRPNGEAPVAERWDESSNYQVCRQLLDFDITLQTTLKGSEGNSEWKRRRWTRLLWVTTTKARQTSTSRRRVSQRCSACHLWMFYSDPFSSPSQTTRRVLEGSLVWRGRKWTKLPWATIIRVRQRNISLRKVRQRLACVHLIHNPTPTGCVCSDYSSGFGGSYGVQTDRMDKVSLYDHMIITVFCNKILRLNNVDIIATHKMKYHNRPPEGVYLFIFFF